MKFESLLERLGEYPSFDYPTVLLCFPEGEEAVRTSLYRFKKTSRILELRRGIYAFSDRYRKASLPAPAVAGLMYAPSYLSELWALSWFGVIPEKVVTFTSVTTRPKAGFENSFGRFTYRSVKPGHFWGWRKETIMGSEVRVASPEKALLDLWYLESGEWTTERFESLRLEARTIDLDFLHSCAERLRSPRLIKTALSFGKYRRSSSEGGVEL
jgi:hypothetical protein